MFTVIQSAPPPKKPVWEFAPGVQLTDIIRTVEEGENRTVAEFIGGGSFSRDFVTRQQYEVDTGREEVPLLYQNIYTVTQNDALPEFVNIDVMGPAAVIFEEIKEGSEVKFVTVGQSTKALQIKGWGAAIEYSKKLFLFNQVWNLSIAERGFGKAHNALLNHLHFYPILSFAYTSANQTAASAVGATLAEKYLSTLEDAINNATLDTANPRTGPYDLLIAQSDLFKIEHALKQRLQDGIDIQSSAIMQIRNVIVYKGWTGARGKKAVTYAGVTAGKSYLINVPTEDQDFQSWVRQDLQSQRGDGDISRFIVEQVVYDTWLGIYSNVEGSVEEITWPT